MIELISKGGIFIWPLLACSIISLAVIIERFILLRKARRQTQEFITYFKPILEKKGIKEALDFTNNPALPLARIYNKGLTDYQKRMDKERLKQIMDETAGVELPVLEKNLRILSVIAHIAPLLGFLGTVTGMINAFKNVETLTRRGEPIGPGNLAGGIWEALITTAVGLGIAIPTYLAYTYFSNFVESLTTEMERNSRDIIDTL